MHLSFQITQPAKAKAIQIYADEAGLNVLEDAIKEVRQNGGHPFGIKPELSDETPFSEEAVSEVIITIGGD